MGRLSPTGNLGTSSGTDPGENFKGPEDLSDILGVEGEIPRTPRSPRGGLMPPKPIGRSPIGIEIGKSAGGGLNVTGSLPLGGPISGRGGINIGGDGTIKGGSIGLGLGIGPLGASIDVGTDQDEKGRGGCYQYATVAIGLFSHSFGRNVCDPKPPTPKPPTPKPPTSPGSSNGVELPDTEEIGFVIFESQVDSYQWYRTNPLVRNWTIKCEVSDITYPINLDDFYLPFAAEVSVSPEPKYPFVSGTFPKGTRYYASEDSFTLENGTVFSQKLLICYSSRYIDNYKACNIAYYGQVGQIKRFIKQASEWSQSRIDKRLKAKADGYTDASTGVSLITFTKPILFIPVKYIEPPPPPLSNPPLPNPPPKLKKMDDKCCKAMIMLQLETLRMLGREIGSNGLMAQSTKKKFLGEEIERIKTPIKNPDKPETIKIKFTTIYELLAYALRQGNNLDVALDPQSYVIPTGKLQNPAYSRDSEHSLLQNDQPNRDKSGNKRELEINKDDEAKIGGFLQQQAYAFQILKRLEYLFPPGELNDALIAKNLLIPGAEGDIKIHNMIMAYEIQMMYLNATFGNPREVLTIKDANPAIEGDQPIEISALTFADWFRQVVKFQIDTGGDVDALINLELRDFRTSLANRTDIIKTAEMTQALFEDSGMREQQDYIPVHLEGDPYAGQWIKGQGFKANPDLEKKTEEATEKVLRETMKPTEIKLKVSRRHKEEKTDMRDLLRGLADFIQRLLSIPFAGNADTAIDKLIESARFKVQTEAALLRANVVKAATASRNRTKKRKK